jgi:hypothetical protein
MNQNLEILSRSTSDFSWVKDRMETREGGVTRSR